MHAVINPVIVLFLGWEVGLGTREVAPDEAANREGGDGGEGEEKGERGGRVIQLKPSGYFLVWVWFWMLALFYGFYTRASDDVRVSPLVPNICSCATLYGSRDTRVKTHIHMHTGAADMRLFLSPVTQNVLLMWKREECTRTVFVTEAGKTYFVFVSRLAV